MNNKILVFIPTYNEVDNVRILYKKIIALRIKNLDILFIDDNSPDGTGKVINSLLKKDKKVFLIRRKKKSGIGTAHLKGIFWAYKHGYRTLISMDSDLTHLPVYIPRLINKKNSYDLVIASRYKAVNSMVGWSRIRKIMTLTSHFIIGFFFRIHYDTSNSYRLYCLDKIPKTIFTLVKSTSYSFFFESLFLLKINGVRIGEIPIRMHERVKGKSKMQFRDIYLYLKMFIYLFINKIFNKRMLLVK